MARRVNMINRARLGNDANSKWLERIAASYDARRKRNLRGKPPKRPKPAGKGNKWSIEDAKKRSEKYWKAREKR